MHLSEYHAFVYDSQAFVLNVEAMKAFAITPALAECLANLKCFPRKGHGGPFVDPRIQRALTQLGLVNPLPDLKVLTSSSVKRRIAHISLNVAQACNMRCIYCYGGGGHYGELGLMSKTTAHKAVEWLADQAGDSSHLIVTFFGGEPLLNLPVIKDTVDFTTDLAARLGKNPHFSITTNGTLLSPEVGAYLNSKSFSVVISVDGDLEVQRRQRPLSGSGITHEQTLQNIRDFLVTRKGHATARATVTKFNADLNAVRTTLVGLGFKRIHMAEASIPLQENGNTTCATCDFGLSPEQQRAWQSYSERVACDTVKSLQARVPVIERDVVQYMKQLRRHRKKEYACGVGQGLAAVSVSGRIYPCHRFVGQERWAVGSVFDPPEEYKPSLGLPARPEQCEHCWTRHFCGGGCLYQNLHGAQETSTPYEPACALVRRNVELAIAGYSQLGVQERKLLD